MKTYIPLTHVLTLNYKEFYQTIKVKIYIVMMLKVQYLYSRKQRFAPTLVLILSAVLQLVRAKEKALDCILF